MEANNNDWLEVAVFIHGITPHAKVKPHAETYKKFYDRLNAALGRKNKAAFAGRPIMVEWGWERSLDEDRHLAKAEDIIKGEVFTGIRRAVDFAPFFLVLRPVYKLSRKVFYYGFNDLFYYVSDEGERTVRGNVFEYLSREIVFRSRPFGESPARKVSLTFFAHSAGSVIAHDLLYHIFRGDRSKEAVEVVHEVHDLFSRGLMRVRKLYTLGSPLGALTMIRNNELIRKLREGEKFRPEDIGLLPAEGVHNPRWVNFWDKDDVFSGPLEFMYDVGGEDGRAVVEDKYVDLGSFLGDLFPASHNKYWTSRRVIDYVAKTY